MRKKFNIFIAAVIFSFILWGSISLSDYYYANIDVKLNLINLPKGYTAGSRLPDKVTIRVKGQGWKLVSVNIASEAEYLVSANNDSGKISVNLFNNLDNNRWIFSELEVIDITPDTITFFIEKIVSKKLPVHLDFDLEYKPGYGLATDIKYNPDTIRVEGPKSQLRMLTEVRTESTVFKQLDSRTETVVKLADLNGFTYSQPSINVVLNVQRIVDKQFDDITVDVVDVPPDMDVLLLPNKIGCNVRGGIEVLGKLKNDQFRAFIYYQDILADTVGSVQPNIDLPANTMLVYLKPERLRYIIKTY